MTSMPPKDYNRLSFNIEKDLHKNLKRFVLEKDTTVTDFIIELIKKELAKEE